MLRRRPDPLLLTEMKNTKRIAMSGVAAALMCAIMYVATVTEILSVTGVVFAAFVVIFIYIEYGTKTALTVYAAVSVVSLLILPDKYSALLFAVFAGYYPVLKAKLEGLRKPLAWLFKIVIFNIVIVILYVLGKYVLALEFDVPAVEITVMLLGNAVFVLADMLASKLIILYLLKYRPTLKKRGLI